MGSVVDMPRFFTLVCQAVFALVFGLSLSAFAQEAQTVTALYKSNDKGYQVIQLRYSLVAPQDNIPCLVRVKYTRGSTSFYLRHVSGDVGNLVLPGPLKEITWDFQEELIHIVSTEPVTFDIEVFPNFSAEKKVKRGRNLIVNLDELYDKEQRYAVKLYRKKRDVATLRDTIALQNHLVIQIPRKTRVGKGYQVGIVGRDHSYFTNSFRVKPIVSNGWKILPVVLVPVYLFTKQQLEQQQDLPTAPAGPTN